MEKIKIFIDSFVEKEYLFTKSKYDINVSDENCTSLANELNAFFDDSNRPNFRRSGREFKNESKKKFSMQNFERVIHRTLFQIKKYKNFDLGDTLKRIVKGEELYACYLSYESDNGMSLDYSDIFYVAETDKGLKIIYNMRYGVKNREWRHIHDLEVLQVLDNGELVSIEKYQAPIEETSLSDYNKE